jgi:hypothetical protein
MKEATLYILEDPTSNNDQDDTAVEYLVLLIGAVQILSALRQTERNR